MANLAVRRLFYSAATILNPIYFTINNKFYQSKDLGAQLIFFWIMVHSTLGKKKGI